MRVKSDVVPQDEKYLEAILGPIRVCASYKPKFGTGQSQGLDLESFQSLYQSDPFYNWFGLDNPLMYAAHKAAGGMTSVYRQIGIGCERVFRLSLRDALGLSEEAARWSYEVEGTGGKPRTLHLDGRISTDDIPGVEARDRFRSWLQNAARSVGVSEPVLHSLRGAVFEVRQGYKSKDSKRQNADIANASNAYANGYLPCVLVLSAQIDADVQIRYRAAKWLVLTGGAGLGNSIISTYAFMNQVVGYDLAGFFERNREKLRKEIDDVLQALLSPEEK